MLGVHEASDHLIADLVSLAADLNQAFEVLSAVFELFIFLVESRADEAVTIRGNNILRLLEFLVARTKHLLN